MAVLQLQLQKNTSDKMGLLIHGSVNFTGKAVSSYRYLRVPRRTGVMKCDDDDTKGKNNKKGRRKKGILCCCRTFLYATYEKKQLGQANFSRFICAYDKKQLGQAKKHMRPLRIKTPSFSVYVPPPVVSYASIETYCTYITTVLYCTSLCVGSPTIPMDFPHFFDDKIQQYLYPHPSNDTLPSTYYHPGTLPGTWYYCTLRRCTTVLHNHSLTPLSSHFILYDIKLYLCLFFLGILHKQEGMDERRVIVCHVTEYKPRTFRSLSRQDCNPSSPTKMIYD
jgi:hypothetical protein